jgi:hypothetical protein
VAVRANKIPWRIRTAARVVLTSKEGSRLSGGTVSLVGPVKVCLMKEATTAKRIVEEMSRTSCCHVLEIFPPTIAPSEDMVAWTGRAT